MLQTIEITSLNDERTTKVETMLDDLKHLYSTEDSIRGKVLLSEAVRVLENYMKVPRVDTPIEKWEQMRGRKMSLQGKRNFIRNIVIQQKIIPTQGPGCLWCGSRRIKEVAKFLEEGFNEYECRDCKQKFFK